MNAQHILLRWERVQHIMTPSRWLMVLRVARAGAAGICSFELAKLNKTESGNCQIILRDAIDLGIVSKGYALQEHTSLKTSVRVRYTITAKGLEFLGLNPMPETDHAKEAA